MKKLAGKKFLLFVDDIYEDLELWYPKLRLIEEGAEIKIAGTEANKTYKGKNGYPCKSDISISEALEEDYDGLIIPGGFAPDKLRRDQRVLSITESFQMKNKLIAYICHAGWIPISAKIVKGYTVTSTPGIKDDLINAGAIWVDKPVVVDRNHVTGRRPDDLPDFCSEIINYFSS